MSSTTPSTTPILLILGSGPRIGKSVATAFAAKGYKIASVARSLNEEDSTPDQLNIKADLSDPSSIPSIFSKVKEALGLPTVIVYNGEHLTMPTYHPI
jgi:NAD(P)-dependent dehydrogenase (short-subunit alcohol dehydrogenase family)